MPEQKTLRQRKGLRNRRDCLRAPALRDVALLLFALRLRTIHLTVHANRPAFQNSGGPKEKPAP